MSGNGPFPGDSRDNRRPEKHEDWDGQYAYPKKPEPAPPAAQQAPTPGYQGRPSPGQGYPDPGQGYPNQPVQGYPTGAPQAPGYAHQQFGAYGQRRPEQKSRVVAGLLGIFLGGFGVHRFYLGHTGIGIAQVVLTCFTGMGAVWGFVEGVMILANARTFRTDAYGVPLK
ncbi:NINE protein [Arthrobacter yangruifuii]|uniref:NINE protein n=1 Tax=Arthrobacter yangruifuii TaxID=2606616 RepID=A0A5N6MSG0_9MICC|nr:TM2 domain-containing protein [Arthrobacter yangruifuii]KAD3720558.1 NINE protein [Arthrobacter yangruifuii]